MLIMGHIDPDADCLGAMLALQLAFQNKRRVVTALTASEIPDNLLFIPNVQTIVPLASYQGKPDLVVLVDCSDLARAGAASLAQTLQGVPMIVIDHHESAVADGDLLFIEPQASATSELIYDLLVAGKLCFNKELATCLYAGIVSDTGGFRYQNTTPSSLVCASHLLAYGVDTQEIRVQLFESRSLASIKVMGTAMVSLQKAEPWLVYMQLTLADKEKYGARPQDCNNIVNYALYTQGAELALLFDEMAPNQIKVSFRSRKHYNVGKVAFQLGGGGHAGAAGATIAKPLAETVALVIEAV